MRSAVVLACKLVGVAELGTLAVGVEVVLVHSCSLAAVAIAERTSVGLVVGKPLETLAVALGWW